MYFQNFVQKIPINIRCNSYRIQIDVQKQQFIEKIHRQKQNQLNMNIAGINLFTFYCRFDHEVEEYIFDN